MMLNQSFKEAVFYLKTPKELLEKLGGTSMMLKTCMQSRKLRLKGYVNTVCEVAIKDGAKGERQRVLNLRILNLSQESYF